VVSGGPLNIAAGKTESIAFSIAAGSNLEEVRTAIKRSREKYKSIPTSIKNGKENLPIEFILFQNYPNPFNPTTTIQFVIPSPSIDGRENLKDFSSTRSPRNDNVWVTLKVYDILGREVATLVDELKQPGTYNSQFSIRNSQLPSGVYFYTLRAGNFIKTKKMIFLK
ncbi:MAG: T9SS type A sorting domain-containing protein, partial [Ignavibacteria bacterium]|nr:T9SS type A sorting domain-containing protein [Ignavibacteria bacterium]